MEESSQEEEDKEDATELGGEKPPKLAKGETGRIEPARKLPTETAAKFKRDAEKMAEEDKPSRRGRGAGGRGGGTGSRRGGAAGSVDVDDAISALTDLVLEVKQDSREVRGYLEKTALVPGEVLCVQEALKAAQKIGKKRQQKRGQNLGSAFVQIGLKLLSQIPATPELQDCSHLLEVLKQFWDTIVEKVSEEELPLYLQIFKVSKPRKANSSIMGGGYAKLTWKFAPMDSEQSVTSQLEIALFRAFKAKGWDVKLSTPPRSTKERAVKGLQTTPS